MRHAIQRSPQPLALRCAAVLGALLLVGSLGVSGAGAASPTPTDDRAIPQPTRESPAVVPGPSVTGGATGAPGTDAPSPTASSSPSTGPTDPSPSGTAVPTDPTPDPSDPSTPPTDPTPSPTESSKPTATPSTSTSPAREPTRPSSAPMAPEPPHRTTPRPSGGGAGSSGTGWSTEAGGTQYSNNGAGAVQQYGKRDSRTGFRVDPVTGFPIHPQTELLIDPSTGRMLTRGSLEPCDFVYDFATGGIRLAGTVAAGEDSGSTAPSSDADGSGSVHGASGETTVGAESSPRHSQVATARAASIGMSPSAMAMVLGALILVGGLWYFLVFVRRPGTATRRRH